MKNKTQLYDIVIIGNYTKDTIISPSGTRNVDGGGFNYGAHVAALMGLKTATVTRLAKQDTKVVEALIALGVDVFPEYTEHSTDMRLFYPTTNVDERILSVMNTAGSFVPNQVKDLHAKIFLINASIRGEVGLDVITELKKKKSIIAADVQGFIRIIAEDGVLVNAEWQEKAEILSKIDVLKTDAVEAEMLTGSKNIKQAAKKLFDWGPREIVLTHRDGLLVLAEGKYFENNFHPKILVGRSGRGDTCIASYVMKRLTSSPDEAAIWAAAVTSLKMEAEGPIKRKLSDVIELINMKYK